MAGSSLELSFAGGPGTIAGMGPLPAEAGALEIVDLGLSQGNVATGFILANVAAPKRQNNAETAYGYKQLLTNTSSVVASLPPFRCRSLPRLQNLCMLMKCPIPKLYLNLRPR